ncbi:MAG: hypothetical protein IKO30_10005 [Lachnospiraceae bacterium]|nr:hypothetical protein [Lachnospiraceae bacterium]
MVKADILHELYEACKEINIDEADDIVVATKDEDEKIFVRTVTDCILQQKQRKIIAEKRF